jgi:1-aminocyclopropane-1-carboxylate deaminase
MREFPDYSKIIVHPLNSSEFIFSSLKVDMLRLDLLHDEISGNKWFKLKYNLEQAQKEKKDTILTFGGAWSNHIVATAAACDLLGFKSIGIIRGEELKEDSSPSLILARRHNMQLYFVSRELYGEKEYPGFIDYLNKEFHQPYIIPEGGNNDLGIKGCKEILSFCEQEKYTHICCAVGTGATLTGLIESASMNLRLLGFSALRNADYLKNKIEKSLTGYGENISWKLITDYHFGGFAKKTPELLEFMRDFYEKNKIVLDFVYTAKMMFGINDLIKKEYFSSGSRILAIHTGGLQGNKSLTV